LELGDHTPIAHTWANHFNKDSATRKAIASVDLPQGQRGVTGIN